MESKSKKNNKKTIAKTTRNDLKKMGKVKNYYYAGFLIIAFTIAELIITIAGGGIWLNNLNFDSYSFKSNSIEGKSFNVEINNVDQDVLFANTYYKALDALSEGISFGTTWLEICPNTQTQINGEIYIQVCDDRYTSVESIKLPLKKYISLNYINKLMDNNYLDYNDKFYIRPIQINKNQKYAGFVSYKLENKTANKITYSVKSKYSELNCNNKCEYTYKDHTFELSKEEGNWVVSNFEMPY